MALPVILENQEEACGSLCAGCADCINKEKRPLRLTTSWNAANRPVAFAKMKNRSLGGGGAMVRNDPHSFNAQAKNLREAMANDGFTQEEIEEYFLK